MVGKFLLLTDFSEPAQAAREVAFRLAQAMDASVEVVHVLKVPWEIRLLPESRQRDYPEWNDQILKAEELLAQLASSLRADGVEADHSLWHKEKIQEIPSLSGNHYDMVFVGTNGRSGWEYILHGSIAEKIMKETLIPVMVVKPFFSDFRLRKLLFATSLDLDTRPALEFLLRLACRSDAEKIFVTRVTTPYNFIPSSVAQTAYEQLVDGLETDLLEYVPVNHYTIEDGVVDMADSLGTDLVSLSMQNRRNLAGIFLDSIPINLARTASQPVLSIRTP